LLRNDRACSTVSVQLEPIIKVQDTLEAVVWSIAIEEVLRWFDETLLLFAGIVLKKGGNDDFFVIQQIFGGW
jgi:hypothetical protein